MHRPLIPIVVAYAIGLTTAHYQALPLSCIIAAGCTAGLLLAACMWFKQYGPASVAALCLFWAAGFFSLQQYVDPQAPAGDLSRFFSDDRVNIEGVITEPPVRLPARTRLRLRVSAIHDQTTTRTVSGTLLLSIKASEKKFRYGDRIRCFVRLRKPRNFSNPGGFDYIRYLHYQGTQATAFLNDDRGITILRSGEGNKFLLEIEHIRDRIRTFLEQRLPAPSRDILKALIIGEQQTIPESVRERFARLGIAHILSISGLHVSIFALVSFWGVMLLLRRSPRLLLSCDAARIAVSISVFPVLLYCSIAGFNIPTLRSAVMVICYLIALLLGRTQDLLHTLFVAAFLVLLLMPTSLFDISFQLSFAAVFWITLLVPAWQQILRRKKPDPLEPPRPRLRRAHRMLVDSLTASAAAILGTAPLVAVYFHYVSWAGFFGNLFAVPLAGFLIVPLGLLASAVLFLNSSLASLIFTASGTLIDWLLVLVEYCSRIPGTALPVAMPSFFETAVYYLLLSLAAFCLTRKRFVYLLAGITLFVTGEAASLFMASRDTGVLTVTFLDVGAGDAAVVRFPDRRVMLIDGGGVRDDYFDVGKSIIAPFLYSSGITRVDYVVLTHPHHDHAGGLAYIADHFNAREIWRNAERSTLEPCARLLAVAGSNKLSLLTCSRLTPPIMINAVRIDFLNPAAGTLPAVPDDQSMTNNNSLVLKISYGSVSILMAADILAEQEHLLADQQLPLAATILKAPHHGGQSSSSEEFINAVAPKVVVVSGRARSSGSALHPSVADRYRRQGAAIYETAVSGAIQVTTDGSSYAVLPFREALQKKK